MIVNVRSFEIFPAHVVVRLGDGELDPAYDGIISVHEVIGEFTIQKSAEEYFFKGSMASDVTLECARCLRQFRTSFKTDTDFIVCPKGYLAKELAVDNEDYVYLDQGRQLADLSDIARQSIIISMALAPLCREDCAGLCATCRSNLNDGPCTCPSGATRLLVS